MVRPILSLHTFVNGTDSDPLFHDITLTEYSYTRNRMGMSSLTATLKTNEWLDEDWSGMEWTKICGERFFIRKIPDPTKGSDDARYVYSITFVSEREALEGAYFYDSVVAVESALTTNKPCTYSTKFTFYGTIYEFAERLNCALMVAGLGDSKIKEKPNLLTTDDVNDDGFCVMVEPLGDFDSSESWEFSFEDTFIATAITNGFDTTEIPFEYQGKKIVFGAIPKVCSHKFKYGVDNELLSITKTNSNNKVVNRVTFKGSDENIPYYYPNESEYGHIKLTTASTNYGIKADDLVLTNAPLLLSRVSEGKNVKLVYYTKGNNVFTFNNDNVTYIRVTDNDDNAGTYVDGIEIPAMTKGFTYKARFFIEVPYNSSCDLSQLTGLYSNGTDTLKLNLSSAVIQKIVFTQISREFGATLTTGVVYTYDIFKTGGMSLDSLAEGLYQVEIYMTSVQLSETRIFTLDEFSITCKVVSDRWFLLVGNNKYSTFGNLGLNYLGGDITAKMNGDTFQWTASERMTFQENLMPTIFRETDGAERFYNAENNKYIDPDTGEYYVFPNPYVSGYPSEYIYTDTDVEPTIKNVTNAKGELIGEIAEIAYDDNDNDSLKADVSDDGTIDSANYEHSYFYIKLHLFDGLYGFDLFGSALQSDSMQLNMTSGNCNGCKFKIQTAKFENTEGTYTFKNPVLVIKENGDLVSGDYSDKVLGETVAATSALSYQQDTTQNTIWICVQKDADTFGVIMPNKTNNFLPAVGDTFTLTNISLPQTYIDAAEKVGEQDAIRYMFDHNEQTFTFDIKCSRVFFAQNPDVLAELSENSKIIVDFNDRDYEMYISSLTIECKDDEALPEISINLENDLTTSDSFVQSVAERAASMIANPYSLGGYYGTLTSGVNAYTLRESFLSKRYTDTASAPITFAAGLTSTSVKSETGVQFGNSFVSGELGVGGKIDGQGRGELRSLKLWERLEVPELRFNSVSIYTGIRWDTFGGGKIEAVEKTGDKTGIITLKLESGQVGAIEEGDLCMGIFHNVSDINETEYYDGRNGVFTFAGFQTIYFRVEKILDDAKSQFQYVLRKTDDNWDKVYHPQAQMDFACYANPTDTNRQWCVYTTPQYSIGLRNMTTWTYDESNIYKISGLLEGFTLNGTEFQGVGDVLGNAYIYGRIEQFENAPLELQVSIDGNNTTIAEGETRTLTCKLIKGFEDLTDTVASWSIERSTSVATSDETWAALAKVKNFNGSIELTYSDISSDDDVSSALFTITATTNDGQKVKASLA